MLFTLHFKGFGGIIVGRIPLYLETTMRKNIIPLIIATLITAATLAALIGCGRYGAITPESEWNGGTGTTLGGPPTSGLLGEWLFTSDSYNDTSGNGNDGEHTLNTHIPASDRFGTSEGALGGTGTQYVTITGVNIVQGLSSFSFSLWFNSNGRTLNDQRALISNLNSENQTSVDGGAEIMLRESGSDYFFDFNIDNDLAGKKKQLPPAVHYIH
jgi:hypothetical protein